MNRTLMGAILTVLSAGVMVAQPAISEGVALLDQRKYQEAANHFSQVVKHFPRDAQSWLHLSRAYVGAGKPDSAEFAGRKAIQFDDENPMAYATLAEALIGQNRLAEADDLLREGLDEAKNHPQLLLQLGFLQLAMDSADAALVTFTRAREVSPDLPRAFEGMGDAYARNGVTPMAVTQYERSVELDPNQPEVMYKLAELYLRDRKYNEAVKWLKQVIALDSTNVEAQSKLADIYYRAKMWQSASRAFGEMLKQNPDDSTVVKLYVESLFNSRQYTLVPDAADRATLFDSSFTEALRMKAVSYYAVKEYKKAVETYADFQKVAELTGEDFKNLGLLHDVLNEGDQAVAAYEKAIAADSSLTQIMAYAGALYMKMQRWEDAARMFKAQFTADTGASRAYYNYAQCKSALRDLKEAAKYYEVAIDHDPEFVPPYASVTTMHVLLEDYKTARRWAERTIEVIDTNVSKYGTELSQAYGYIGLDMLLAKNFDGAIKNLKKSIDLEPKNESALLWMALSLHNAQKLDEALRYYKLVLKVNKNNKQAQDGVTAIEGASK